MRKSPLPTVADMINQLRQGRVEFPPVCLAWEDSPRKEINGILRIRWHGTSVRFAIACKRASNPKSLTEAAIEIRKNASLVKLRPLIVVPYLDDAALGWLEDKNVSGIDLCGNGVIIATNKFYLRQVGNPNRFCVETTIKNIYRGNSSTVARLFLVKPWFDSVQDAVNELTLRGGQVTLATVSKVCKRLEEDLIIERRRGNVTTLRLLQPDKLLDKLTANYVAPTESDRVTGKLRESKPLEFRKLLQDWARKSASRVALTGASSVSAYAVMARQEKEEYFCSDVASLLRTLGARFQPTDRFATIVLRQIAEHEMFFDRRDDLTASPIQTYLELSKGDKRDQETAAQVRRLILNAIPSWKAKS